MAKLVNVADLPVSVALFLLKILNIFVVSVKRDETGNYAIFSRFPPNLLKYPNGWYYAKGCFRNKHNTTTGQYTEVIMLAPNGRGWDDMV
jgi:hypothetical protein